MTIIHLMACDLFIPFFECLRNFLGQLAPDLRSSFLACVKKIDRYA